MSTVAERLAAFTSVAQRRRDAGRGGRTPAKLHLLDTLGCGLAAHALGVASGAREAMLEPGAAGPASAIGVPHGLPARRRRARQRRRPATRSTSTTRTPARSPTSASPSSPAALAAAEAEGATGAELLAAIVAGNEVVTRLGMAAGDAVPRRGFHPTARPRRVRRRRRGRPGCAASTPRRPRRRSASRAAWPSGILEYLADGSSTKRLHAGLRRALRRRSPRALAAHGATGPRTVIEGRFGLYNAFLRPRRRGRRRASSADLGERWETPRIAFKPYPACHFLHASLDATARGRRRRSRSSCRRHRGDRGGVPARRASRSCSSRWPTSTRPRSEYDAKFSLPYSVASYLMHGRVDVMTYIGDAIADQRVLELAATVRYEVRGLRDVRPRASLAASRIRTKDGRGARAHAALPAWRPGEPDGARPRSWRSSAPMPRWRCRRPTSSGLESRGAGARR